MMTTEEYLQALDQRITTLQAEVSDLQQVVIQAVVILKEEVQRLEKRIEALDGIQP